MEVLKLHSPTAVDGVVVGPLADEGELRAADHCHGGVQEGSDTRHSGIGQIRW